MKMRILMLALLTVSSVLAQAQVKVAVVVYGQTPEAEQYARVAQTRLEQLLNDNGSEVIDQKRADELKKNWRKLADPGALLTAEEFVENAKRFEIAGVYRIYLGLGKTKGLAGIHVATAASDVRFVGENAVVKAAASSPMGVKGMPPSDGLTEQAAVSNAIQRSVDSAGEKLGLKIVDITNPRLVSFSLRRLEGPVPNAAPPAYAQPPRLAENDPLIRLARFADDSWNAEESTCVRKSPDQRMAAIGGYLTSTVVGGGRPTRSFSSTLHVVDLDARREILSLPISKADFRLQRGGSKITDCLFLQSWRYVAALSQSHVALFDTERGIELGRDYFENPFTAARLAHLSAGDNDYLVVSEGARVAYYQIERK